jgi:hypothetical protein
MIRGLGGRILHLAGRAADLGKNAGHASEAGVTCLPSCDGIIDNSGKFEFTTQQVISYLVLGGDRRSGGPL